jgi:uncharacterized SAM-binding protein YcdF (DUF218 family)
MELPRRVDAVVILGSLDDMVAVYAAQILDTITAKAVIISGSSTHHGILDDAPDWKEASEAAHFAAVMKREGHEGELFLEPDATNTGDNAILSARLLAKAGIRPRSILIVTKPYMERRALRTFEKQWPNADDVTFYVASAGGTFEDYIKTSQSFEHTVNSMVGDLERIIIYPKQGFMTQSDVPGEVIKALDRLKASGFTRSLK